MAKHKYTAHVRVEGGTEEVQFEPQADAPRIPSRYQHDSAEFGKFKDGKTYSLDPDKVAAELEEEIAAVQEEAAQADAAAMKDADKKGRK